MALVPPTVTVLVLHCSNALKLYIGGLIHPGTRTWASNPASLLALYSSRDGLILAVIFDDPGVATSNSVTLLTGHQVSPHHQQQQQPCLLENRLQFFIEPAGAHEIFILAS